MSFIYFLFNIIFLVKRNPVTNSFIGRKVAKREIDSLLFIYNKCYLNFYRQKVFQRMDFTIFNFGYFLETIDFISSVDYLTVTAKTCFKVVSPFRTFKIPSCFNVRNPFCIATFLISLAGAFLTIRVFNSSSGIKSS